MSVKPRLLGPLAAAAVLGFALWAASPVLTGYPEPWDADGPFYALFSLLSGALLAFWRPWRLLSIYIGFWVGQVVATVTLPGLDRSWWLLGVFTTAIGSVLVLPGGLVGSISRRLLGRRRKSPGEVVTTRRTRLP
jgi:hypothetical protein